MRGIMMAGIALLVAGAIGLASLFASGGMTAPGSADAPSALWSIVVGLALAAGGALFGIGMNSWRQGSPRTIQRPPGC